MVLPISGVRILPIRVSPIWHGAYYKENMASHAFAEYPKIAQCVVIMINVDDSIYPYGALACFTRPADA
jgi:hypothetical protein